MNKKGLFTIIGGAALAFVGLVLAGCSTDRIDVDHVHHWGEPTWSWQKNDDTYVVKATFVCELDSSHVEVVDATVNSVPTVLQANDCSHDGRVSYTAFVSFNNQTYTNSKEYSIAANGHHIDNDWAGDTESHWHNCSDCTEKVDLEEHTLATRVTEEPASCTKRGRKVEEVYCTVCGRIVSTNVTNTGYGSHKYEITKDVKPTCVNPGQLVKTCTVCGQTITQDFPATGEHTWDKALSCTEGHTCTVCGQTEEKLGHDMVLDEEYSYAATCTTDGQVAYKCSRCDHHDEHVLPKGGHKPGEWETTYESVPGTPCLYDTVLTTHCTDPDCGEEIRIVDPESRVYKHHLVSQILENSTCSHQGKRVLACDNEDCTYVSGEQLLPLDPNNHEWEETYEGSGVFTCPCGATKTIVTHEEEGKATLSSDALNATEEDALMEVDLGNASFQISNEVIEQLKSEEANLSVSAETTNAADAGVVDEELLEKIGNSPIYDFSIKNGDNKAEFNGEIVVTVPHTLKDDEDPESIIIWYIGDNDEITPIEANFQVIDPANPKVGYAVFTVSHFSRYTVQYLTAQERCARYGHRLSEEVTVQASCLQDGYTYQICSVCNETLIKDRVAATGHNYVDNPEGSTAPTCTKDGHTDKVCTTCGAHYGEIKTKTGHEYEEDVSRRVEATCLEKGYAYYVCSHCDENEPGHEIINVIPAKGHDYQKQVTKEATCLEEGTIEYKCSRCDDIDESKGVEAIPALGHHYVLDEEASAATEGEYSVYVCDRDCCDEHVEGHVKQVRNGSALFTKEKVQETGYFTNVAESIVGKEITIKANGVEFVLGDGSLIAFKGDNAEIHVGLDKDNNLLAYGNGNVEITQKGKTEGGEIAFYLKDGKFYAKSYNATTETTYYFYQDLAQLSLGSYGSITVGEILDYVPEIIGFINEDVRPFIDEIVELKKDEINEIAYNVYETFLNVEYTADGYKIYLDIDKLINFASMFTDEKVSVKDILDYVLGEGKTDALLDEVRDLTMMSLYDALNKIKEDFGLDYQKLLALIDKGVARFSDYNSYRDMVYDMSKGQTDINNYLNESFLKNNSVVSLVKDNNEMAEFFGDGTIATFIDKEVRELLDQDFCTLLGTFMPEENVIRVKDTIENIVNEVSDIHKENPNALVISFSTDEEGNFISLNLDADLEIEDMATIKGHVSIEFGEYTSLYNYQEITNFLDRNIDRIGDVKYGTDEKIRAAFDSKSQSDFVDYHYDEDGHITGVTTYSNLMYSFENAVPVAQDSDLIKYYRSSFYNKLIETYQEYKEKEGVTLYAANTGYREVRSSIVTGFVPSSLTMTEACKGTYSIEYSIPGYTNYGYSYTNFGSVALLAVDDKGNIVDGKVFSDYNNSSMMNYESGKLAINANTNELIDAPIAHNYIKINDTHATCGEEGVITYKCSVCGKIQEKEYIGEHTALHLKDATLINIENPYPSCYSGVRKHYHCDDCGQDIYENVYEHVAIKKHDDFTATVNGEEIHGHLEDCLCGEEKDKVVLDGYIFVDVNETFTSNGVSIDVYCYQKADSTEMIYFSIAEAETSPCHYTKMIGFYEDASNHDEAVEVVNLYTETRHQSGILSYKDLEERDGEYYSTIVCNHCGASEEYHIENKNAQYYFALFPSDLGLDEDSSELIFHASINDIEGGFIRDFNPGSHNHSMSVEYKDQTEYWTCNEEDCNYAYSIKTNVEMQVEGCEYTEVVRYTFYNKNDMDHPLYVLNDRGRNEWNTYSKHTCQETLINSISAPQFKVNINTYHLECEYCDYEDNETRFVFLEEGIPYDEHNTEGIEYYSGLYYPTSGLFSNGDRSYYVTDPETNITTATYSRITIEEFTNGKTGETVTYVARHVEIEQYIRRNGSNLWINNQSINERYDLDGNLVLSSSSETRYLYPNDPGFAEAFHEATRFDYVPSRDGCLYVRVYLYDGEEPQYVVDGFGDDPYGPTPVESNYVDLDYAMNKHYGELVVDHDPTCTQCGIGHCSVCGQTVYIRPTGHDWEWHYNENSWSGYYTCEHCSVYKDHYYGGDWEGYVLEDMSDEDNFVIGAAPFELVEWGEYYKDVNYTPRIDVIYFIPGDDENDDEYVRLNVSGDLNDTPCGAYIYIVSRDDVRNALEEKGYAYDNEQALISFDFMRPNSGSDGVYSLQFSYNEYAL